MNASQAREARATEAIRKAAADITIKDGPEGSKLVKVERGHLTGTIAGRQVHKLTYQVRTWDDETQSLHVQPDCGTIRNSSRGGHYVNYYSNLGRPVTCAKCASR